MSIDLEKFIATVHSIQETVDQNAALFGISVDKATPKELASLFASGNILRNYRAGTEAGLGTLSAVRLAVTNTLRIGVRNMVPISALATDLSVYGIGMLGQCGIALGLGSLLGYGLVKSGVGESIGLKALGEYIADHTVVKWFQPQDTHGKVFQLLDGAMETLGLNTP